MNAQTERKKLEDIAKKITLKPCPFCGSDALLEVDEDPRRNGNFHLGCSDRDCKAHRIFYRDTLRFNDLNPFGQAVARWNDRNLVSQNAQPAQITFLPMEDME